MIFQAFSAGQEHTKLLDPGFRILDLVHLESWVQDPGLCIQISGSRILDAGLGIQDSGSRIQDPESRIQDPRSKIRI